MLLGHQGKCFGTICDLCPRMSLLETVCTDRGESSLGPAIPREQSVCSHSASSSLEETENSSTPSPDGSRSAESRGRAGDRGKDGFHPSSQCQLFRFASFFVVVVHNHHNHNLLLLLLLLLRFVCFVGEVGNATNRWEKESNCLELGRRD